MVISRPKFETFDETSGQITEAKLLGTIKEWDENYRKSYEDFLRRNRELIERKLKKDRLSVEEDEKLFRECVKLVEDFPSDNPLMPEHQFLRDFREAAIDAFECRTVEEAQHLSVYSSVGSPLDRLFQSDWFLRVDNPDSKKEPDYVTFDLSKREKKTGTGADILVKDWPDADLEEEKYLKFMAGLGYDARRVFFKKQLRAVSGRRRR